MNRILKTCLLLLLAALCFYPVVRIAQGKPILDMRAYFGPFTGPTSGTNRDDNVKGALDRAYDQALAGLLGTSGTIFYCDSGETSGTEDGLSWATATDTLDEAIDLCSNNDGDIILIAPGHAETFTAADGWDANVIGITIIGLGNGTDKPTFTFNHADAEVAIGADNVTIKNLRFLTTITAVLIGVDIEAGSDYTTISGCEWWEEGDNSNTDEFNSALRIGNACIGTLIENNVFKAEAAGAISAIHSDNDTSFTMIRNNFFTGDYSSGCINFISVASTDLSIIGNIIINGDMATADTSLNPVAAINCVEATSGIVVDNRIFSATATHLLMRVADDMCFSANYTLDHEDDAASAIIEHGASSITADADAL